jgi:transposase InsO family protein
VQEAWREEYNNHRPHGSLGDRTPMEYKTIGYYVPDRDRLLNLRA